MTVLLFLFIKKLARQFILTKKRKQKYSFLIIEPTRCTNFLNILFWNETLHVSDSFSVHHQEFFTVHTTMVYVIQVC
jgi:hypothetical protein